eukprot:CAMPEP_0194213392 /NCGR_PEP_ID=MMETSP0156-20130528/13918_1 /TAXON_ID=33649 /ORGANISM="Thalassionema nitzschioides, Strain L26-B" /LENGTH=40 /DNA_ID= /DNA_START= /DNA_END= /DNA_ORIENTATION=
MIFIVKYLIGFGNSAKLNFFRILYEETTKIKKVDKREDQL